MKPKVSVILFPISPPTARQKDKVPVLIPIAVGLVGKDGKDLPLLLNDNRIPPHTTQYVLPLVKDSEEFVFTNVPAGTRALVA